MTLYYAVGGGLGHQARAQRVLRALGLDHAEIMTSADLPADLEGDREAHRRWLEPRTRGRHVIVDAFPAGIQGELSGIEGATFDHVARLLRWKSYREAVPFDPPYFATTYVVEGLDGEHEAMIRANSERVVTLALSPPLPSEPEVSLAAPYSLIVHSGPTPEVEELVAYARELGDHAFHVVTRCDVALPEGFHRLTTDRPFDYFERAERLVTAAGFNVMLETEPWRHKRHIVPFPRRYDDQFLRAARARRPTPAS
ncbi:MAG: hypothetical protein ABI672_20240 [Vicinamibacteria bacterium]